MGCEKVTGNRRIHRPCTGHRAIGQHPFRVAFAVEKEAGGHGEAWIRIPLLPLADYPCIYWAVMCQAQGLHW